MDDLLPPFEIGFWHPFGPHGLESAEQILERKAKEILANGWTLWSFQYRQPKVIESWQDALRKYSTLPLVFCSDSKTAKDPSLNNSNEKPETCSCRRYRTIGELKWNHLPETIQVIHPFRNRVKPATAFIVQRVFFLRTIFDPYKIEWESRGVWKQSSIPTRPEYLIRRGGDVPHRSVRAILQLKDPFLATVSPEQE